MVIRDRVYGSLTIKSALLIELINSKSVQRLKGICQFGIPDEFYHLKNFTRFEHSVGVMHLLNKLGATEEEQVAGLLHDVSHTAFSHTIDWVLGDGSTEDYQDEQHQTYIIKSDIPPILRKHGYSVDRISDYHHFGLLERNIPDLCADRIDYSVREFNTLSVKACVPQLTVAKNKIVFKTKSAALIFARNFLDRQTKHWGSVEAVSRYRLFADILKTALEAGYINYNDFWLDDSYILRKLTAVKNNNIAKPLEILRHKNLTNYKKSSNKSYKKFRYVDPQFVENNKLIRLSDADNGFSKLLKEAREQNAKGIEIPLITY